MIKVVFLDIDGVLNHGVGTGLHEDKVKLLNPLAEHAVFILSSNWRMSVPIPAMQQFLQERGFKGQLVGRTCILPKEARGVEIANFIEQYGDQIESWVILDDITQAMTPEQRQRHIHTTTKVGITEAQVQEALNLLLS